MQDDAGDLHDSDETKSRERESGVIVVSGCLPCWRGNGRRRVGVISIGGGTRGSL